MITAPECDALHAGLALHADGRLEQAARFYSEALEHDSRNSDAWNLLGRVWLAKGDFESAAACVIRAVRLRPDLPAFHATLGDILSAQGRGREAALCYREALRLEPLFQPALVNLGNLLQKEGRLEDAAVLYARAIEADSGCAEALNNLGNTLTALGRGAEAAECFYEAVRRHPDAPEAPVNLAALCLRDRRFREAEQWARAAVSLRPGLPQALSNLSLALLNQHRYAEAESPARQAVAQAPAAAHLLLNLGTLLLYQKRWEEAEQVTRRALQLDRQHPEADNNLGVILQFTGRLEQAAARFEDLLARHPRNADAWTNLGTVRDAQSLHDDALACFEKALGIDSGHAKAHFCHSLEVLARGRLAEGFEEYEWRWEAVRERPRASDGPAWNGERLDGRTILISAEQGLGDTLQFARYIPHIARRGGRVIVEAQPAAASLVRKVEGVAAVITPGEPLPDFDVQAAMMSLPRILATVPETIPTETPYIWAGGRLRQHVAERMGPRRGLRVGLCWFGNPENGGDRRRSMPLETLLPLAGSPGVEWFSLHVGEKARNEARSCGGWVRGILSDTGGLEELAAVMKCLDLVITVDTMPAHLAGALAVPVWNLLCHAPDWRWMREREDSPWYPTMRLFRQPAPGDWASVVKRVGEELGRLPIQDLTPNADT
jgi:tetratricopeptide (TPR) repeat protein